MSAIDKLLNTKMKSIKKETRKYNLISDLKILQRIPLFQAISASKSDTLPQRNSPLTPKYSQYNQIPNL